MRARLAVVAAIAAVLLGLSGCSAAPEAEAPVAPVPEAASADAMTAFPGVPLVPDEGVLLGMYYGDGSPDGTDDAIGLTPSIHLTYVGWQDGWATDPVLARDTARGQVSLVNWEPFDVEFADIVAGRYDALLTQRGREAAALDAPVFVDFAAEMNEEEGWGGHDPALYVAAYRHVHDLVSAEAGDRVVWVWAPNNVDSAGAPAALEYYPGDDYVDWTGIDGYNWGTSDPDFEWQSFESVVDSVYDDLHTIGKPVIIGETASAETGGSKAGWIRDIVPTLTTRFPDIRALVWFDVDKERDWRIRSSPAALQGFRALASDPLFIPAGG
ncbi:glycosyl hydrolase [Herbiconiux sp. CPCC 205716]|uniref:Glycosyl hydrolase n=1 Tax=Herbiconiux gentiana TaxID=2970912 RepID=A0ABT2GLZ1_9MICO|nr:glycosyl hydrolase [Herbiconiux gentiana]MCS5716280.1 glycosyl hydrolase [Herbiconiux gentiana]